MQTEIEIRANEWLQNAGIVGFLNIVGKENVRIDGQSLYFPTELLENFETKYFNYFIKEYKETLAWYKIVSYKEKMEYYRAEDFASFDEKALEDLNKYIKDVVEFYLTKSNYIKVFELIDSKVNINEWVKKLKKNILPKKVTADGQKEILEQVKETYRYLDVIISFCDTDKGLKYLGARNVSYTIIKKSWFGVSFLNSQAGGDSYKEYEDYFVKPLLDYLNIDLSKTKKCCFVCNRPVKKLDLDFSFMNDVGFDKNRKRSHVWDFNLDVATCPICRLIYSCVPAGFTFVQDQGLFVNDSFGINKLCQINNQIHNSIWHFNKNGINATNSYQALVASLTMEKENKRHYELADIQLVRYENKHYSFNLLSKQMLYILSDSKSSLQKLIHCNYKEGNLSFNLYEEVINLLMNNENMFRVIHKLILYKQTKVKKLYYRIEDVANILEINKNYLKEKNIMTEIEQDDLWIAQRCGEQFKKAYGIKHSENKIIGITFKLLNALKLNDKNSFMDILLNSYSYLGKPVPKIFMSTFSSAEVFKSIGYSFMIGVSKEINKKDNGGKIDEK